MYVSLCIIYSTLFTGGRYVLAGTNNTDDGSGVHRNVKRLVIHPLFSVGPYWLDADEFNLKQVCYMKLGRYLLWLENSLGRLVVSKQDEYLAFTICQGPR